MTNNKNEANDGSSFYSSGVKSETIDVEPSISSPLINQVFVTRKNKVLINEGTAKNNIKYVLSIMKNIEPLGYIFDPDLIERLCTLELDYLSGFHNNMTAILRQMTGAHRIFTPMYPNFPKQVMEASDLELYVNAIMHYFGDWIGLRILPKYEKKERSKLFDDVELKVISLGTEEEFKTICKNLISANTSISENDKEDIEKFAAIYTDDIESILPDNIPQKETLAFVTSVLMMECESHHLLKFYKTATDVLRLVTSICGGDVSLATNTKYISFRRAQRVFFLELLENCGEITEDMLRHKKKWIRLGERLHPGDYYLKYPKVYEAFDILRNNKPFKTFSGKIEEAIAKEDVLTAIGLLKQRPGEFARRLDKLLRIGKHNRITILQFSKVSDKVSTPVLLQVLTHFLNRDDNQKLRVFFPKGNVARVYAIGDRRKWLERGDSMSVVVACRLALRARFSKLPPLGKVYVDPKLEHYNVPFSQRSASKSLVTLTRGTKLLLDTDKTLRFFLWWKDGDERIDIDLSVAVYGEDWDFLEQVSYTNLRSRKFNICHSGDITSAPIGASEFIDLDIKKIREVGGRYVVPQLYSFTEQPYCDLPECFVGWMEREYPESGEIFDPKTVKNKVDLSANTKVCLPVIIDLKLEYLMWTDISLKNQPGTHGHCGLINLISNNFECNARGVELMGRAMLSMTKPNLYELFSLHTKARGTISAEGFADTIFSVDKGITPFDIEIIMSEYMQ